MLIDENNKESFAQHIASGTAGFGRIQKTYASDILEKLKLVNPYKEARGAAAKS
jgi:hypothetical protein